MSLPACLVVERVENTKRVVVWPSKGKPVGRAIFASYVAREPLRFPKFVSDPTTR